VKSQGCGPEGSIEILLLQVCADLKDFNTWKCLKFYRKECVQEFYERFKVGESSEGIRLSKESKKGRGQVT
jgi:hypothetical protein